MKKIIYSFLFILFLLFNPLTVYVKEELEVKIIQPLSGVVIVLDAGHGYPDRGAMSIDINESDINLILVRKTKERLTKAGAKVIFTRSNENDLSSKDKKNRKRDDMKKRAKIINNKKVDLFLSIHLNAYPSSNVKGSQVYFRKDDEQGKVFANIIQNNFKKFNETRMVPKDGDYFILNKTKPIGVLVECGFISNHQDRANLCQESYQNKIADCLYSSIKEYLNMLE
ncbi:MAG: N-acetylmuramoyl-L-alanine amidase [Erysipelotrichaceae bacterium]